MKGPVAVETEETDCSTETESLLGHTPRRMSDPKIEKPSSEAVTLENVEDHLLKRSPVTNPFIQQLAHLCELMKELRDAKTLRRHKETASSRIASTSAGSKSWFDRRKTSRC